MGSGISSTANEDAPRTSPRPSPESNRMGENNDSPEFPSPSAPAAPRGKKSKPPGNESVYSRAQRICRKKKQKYDACYTAQLSSKEEDCDDLFESYRTCFLRVMAKDMTDRGVKISEHSMIGEYEEETKDEESNR